MFRNAFEKLFRYYHFFDAVEEGDLEFVNAVLALYSDDLDKINAYHLRIIEDGYHHAPGHDMVTALYVAAVSNRTEIIKALLAAGADPNKGCVNGITPLFAAILNHSWEAFQAMLNHADNLDLDQFCKDCKHPDESITALYLAARHSENAGIVVALLDKGADPNKGRTDGWTPLTRAADCGNESIIDILLNDARTNVNITDDENHTALHYAAQEGHLAIVKKLIAAGAKLETRSASGKSALDYARYEKNWDIFEYLVELKRQQGFEGRLTKINIHNDDVPDKYCCPISTFIMQDPITLTSGITYDRDYLILWHNHQTKDGADFKCPLSSKTIDSDELNNETNVFIKNEIEKFVASKEVEFKAKNIKTKMKHKKKKANKAMTLFKPNDNENTENTNIASLQRRASI